MSDYTVTSLSRNSASAALSRQNGQADADIDCSAVCADRLMIEITTAEATSALFTIGTDANGILADIGVLEVTLAQNETKIIGPLESARFTKSTGKINVLITDTDGSSYNGTIANVKVMPFVMPFN